jgi:hypothetical protein
VSVHLRDHPLLSFFSQVFIWLGLCLVVWFTWSSVLNWPSLLLADLLMQGILPEVIDEVIQVGSNFDVVTRLSLPSDFSINDSASHTGNLVFSLNPLIYSFGIPLYSALLLASPSEEGVKWRQWLVGMSILLFTQTWGVSFDILKTLLFNLGDEVSQALAFTAIQVELTALAYQLGNLIMPMVMPVIIWSIQYHEFILRMNGKAGKGFDQDIST